MNYQALSVIVSLLFHTAFAFTILHFSARVPTVDKPFFITLHMEKPPPSSKEPEITKRASHIRKSSERVQSMPHKGSSAAKKKEVLKTAVPDTNVPEAKERQLTHKEPDAVVLPKQRETVPEEIIPDEPVEEKIVHHSVHEDIPAVVDTSSKVSSDHTAASGGAEEDPREYARSLYIKQHYKYISRIIQGNITYPYIAKKMLWEGRVILSFIIKGDGSVQDICLEQSSGFDVLDDNAKETVRNTAPFPPPVVEAKIILPIVYRLM